MFSTSRKNHSGEDLWWPVLSFGPKILTDPGVVFATTNNSYGETVVRGEGVSGLEAMFGPSVPWGHYGSVSQRDNGLPDSWTTNDQAEVLYPTQLGLEYLRAIYVESHDRVDEATGLLGLWPATADIPVICKPEVCTDDEQRTEHAPRSGDSVDALVGMGRRTRLHHRTNDPRTPA